MFQFGTPGEFKAPAQAQNNQVNEEAMIDEGDEYAECEEPKNE